LKRYKSSPRARAGRRCRAADQRVVARASFELVGRPRRRRGNRRLHLPEEIIAVAAYQYVVAALAVEQIVARAAVEEIGLA